MREAYNDAGLIVTEEGEEPVGINLGYDFCAEHEYGIKGLIRMFGIDTSLIGVEARQITQSKVHFEEFPRRKYAPAVLASRDTDSYMDKYFEEKMESKLKDIRLYTGERLVKEDNAGFASYWNENNFMIIAVDDRVKNFLRDLHEAFQRNDVCIGLSAARFWLGAGLTLIIKSRLPESYITEVRESDLSRKRLKEAVKKTGIEKRLKEAGCHYFALSPRWDDEDETKFRFWLNPMKQDIHNHGWYTINDLEQWVEGRGPIIKGEN